MNWGPLIIGDEITAIWIDETETENVKNDGYSVLLEKLTPFC